MDPKDWKENIEDQMTAAEIEAIVNFDHGMPSKLLGPHWSKGDKRLSICAFSPGAEEAWVRPAGEGKTPAKRKMKNLHPNGFFRIVFDEPIEIPRYKLVFRFRDGRTEEIDDPYAFSTDISDFDLHLLGEGKHFRVTKNWALIRRPCSASKGFSFPFGPRMPGRSPLSETLTGGAAALT